MREKAERVRCPSRTAFQQPDFFPAFALTVTEKTRPNGADRRRNGEYGTRAYGE
ncbi:hypothetical protein HMPREF1548_03765 [Clostridium sp. KLE 1755]|nr:hypothetical protein HMPREF1548_03765 [Clostridium sp. KLE 1755]